MNCMLLKVNAPIRVRAVKRTEFMPKKRRERSKSINKMRRETGRKMSSF